MDPYIRDFTLNTVKTEVVSTCAEGNQVLNINNNLPNFKLLHNNTRSINKNLDELKCYLTQFTFNFECIVLTETWQIQNLDLFKLNGYDTIYNKGVINQNDGIIIYIKSDLEFSHKVIELENNNRIIEIILNCHHKTFLIIAIYRSPSNSPDEFINCLNNYLVNNKHQVDYTLIVGDINIDILKTTDISLSYLNTLFEYDFISTINDFTRCRDSSKSCIDHIFVKTVTDLDLLLPLIIKTTVTDHYFTILQTVIDTTKHTEKNINILKRVDEKKLNHHLSQLD